MKKIRTYIAMIMLAAMGFSVSASTFTLMTADDVSTLLGTLKPHSSREDSPIAMTETQDFGNDRQSMARIVSAMEMVSKVYGVVDPEACKSECMRCVEAEYSLTPREEEGNLWLDSADGYNLCYSGVTPEVAAMASYGSGEALEEYCYFFIFPYNNLTKEEATKQQCGFTGSLLQEIYDHGCEPGVNADSDDLMEVTGSHEGTFIDIRLLDDNRSDAESRYILMLIVQPNAYTEADAIAAL